ncbi:MAG: SagB/ThcOx family dehydrogenase [Bryobacteraceae bacterium]|jgi:SagB-type dehydrogenase family enzyme
MRTKRSFPTFLLLLAAAVLPAAAQELKPVVLPKPETTGGKPLMQALAERRSTREFSAQQLSPQVLSNLLWAAFGVNRPDGKRTAPSAINMQEIDIYVATAEGVYLYDAKANLLRPVAAGDLRGVTGMQGFVKTAPLNLVYVADAARMGAGSESDKTFYSGLDTGFIAQNVYLFCASEGLVTVVRGMIDRPGLVKALNLRPEQRPIVAQTVGYPKK